MLLDDHDLEWVRPAPAEVLETFQRWLRQHYLAEFGKEPVRLLLPETAIYEWRMEYDALEWRPLGRAMNKYWRMEESDAAWKSVLKPESRRTLGGVCDFIAARGWKGRIRPVTILGRSCESAGAFLTVRTLLKRAGADVTDLAPSTELVRFAVLYQSVFQGSIEQLVHQGELPWRFHSPLQQASQNLAVASFLLINLSWALQNFVPQMALVTLAGFAVLAPTLLISTFARHLAPVEVTLGSVKTFRDLANFLARQSSRRAKT